MESKVDKMNELFEQRFNQINDLIGNRFNRFETLLETMRSENRSDHRENERRLAGMEQTLASDVKMGEQQGFAIVQMQESLNQFVTKETLADKLAVFVPRTQMIAFGGAAILVFVAVAQFIGSKIGL